MSIPDQQAAASKAAGRIGLLDTLRGVALLAMASYHFSWDLEFFGYLAPGTAEAGWLKLYARGIASSFLFIVGISLTLATARGIRWRPFAKREAMVAGSALAISVATFFATPDAWIYFGILHAIAVLSLIGLVFVRMPLPVLLAATLAAVALFAADLALPGGLWRSADFNTRLLAWTGFAAYPPRTNDFVPIFPWLVPFMLGLTCGRLLLATGAATRLAGMGEGLPFLARLGRHSLLFYLLHQPVLIAIAWALSMVVPPAAPDETQTYLRQCQASCQQQEDEALCRRFCQCTLDRLNAEGLFTPFNKGAVKADDPRIQALGGKCSASSR